MKSVLLIVWMIFLSVASSAQDFVSRFMDNHVGDSNLTSVSISPKMMEEILKFEENDEIQKMISSLKSMRLLTSGIDGEKYFKEAAGILDKNTNRFETYLSFDGDLENFRMMVRKKNNMIVELVMLICEKDSFKVINFTGHMNDGFITKLAKTITVKRL